MESMTGIVGKGKETQEWRVGSLSYKQELRTPWTAHLKQKKKLGGKMGDVN